MPQADVQFIKLIYILIQRQPGNSAYRYAKWLGMHPTNFQSRLLTMENNGFLISQDRHGGLHPFRQPGDTGKLI